MQIKGNIYITTDINLIMSIADDVNNPTEIVFIGEPDQNLVKRIRGIIGSVILPSYNTVRAILDNNPNFVNMYKKDLSQEYPMTFLATIIKALIMGKNILLYMTKDEHEMYFSVLQSFILETFGIVIGNEQKQPAYSNKFDANVCNILYSFSLMTMPEYMFSYPINMEIPQNIIRKMIYEYNPYVTVTSYEGYKQYFEDYRKDLLKYKRPLIIPIRRYKK